MIKAVVFDMFETLVSLFDGLTYFAEDIAANVGADYETLRKEWHAIEKDRSIGVYSIEEGLATVFKKIGIYSEENVRLCASGRIKSLTDTFDALPDETIELFDELKKRNIKIGLITNTFSDERDFIRESRLMPYFDAALISYEVGMVKPDIRLYEKMTELLGVKPEECLYVGDGGSKELYGARDAGMNPVQCTWFHDKAFEPHIPCGILEDFNQVNHQTEVIDYILRLNKETL